MNEVYNKTRSILERELEKISNKGDINATELELTYKIVDIIKDISEICEKDMAMEEMYNGEYSSRRGYNGRRSNMYSNMYDYSSDGGYSSRNGYNSRNYNGSNSRNTPMMNQLQSMLNEAANDRDRMMIQSWMNEIRE